MFGGQIDQQFSGGRGYFSELGGHPRCGGAAEGPHVKGSQSGISHHEVNRLDADMQFISHNLAERSADILTNLDLACVNRDFALLVNVNPGADFLGHITAKTPTAPLTGRLQGKNFT